LITKLIMKDLLLNLRLWFYMIDKKSFILLLIVFICVSIAGGLSLYFSSDIVPTT